MADISISFFSKLMWRHVNVKVVLPFDVEELFGHKAPYKTLYFLPGYSANAQSILSQTIIAEEAAYKGFAVVIPDGENSFYADQPEINAFYEKYIAEELVEVTRRLFPLSTKREDTYIGGISMGGFGSLMVGSHYTDTFSKIVAMSPAVHPHGMIGNGFFKEQLDYYFKGEENYMENYHPINQLVKAKNAGKTLPKIYVCCGMQDPLTYGMCRDFAKDTQEAGIDIVYHENEGVHDTKYWNKMLPEAMEFMMAD